MNHQALLSNNCVAFFKWTGVLLPSSFYCSLMVALPSPPPAITLD